MYIRRTYPINSSVVTGQELSTASTSAINVERASSFKLVSCVMSCDDKMFLADFIYCCHTPPIWFVVMVFLVQTSQSAPFFRRKYLIYVLLISWKAFLSLFSVLTKLVPLLLLMLLILPLLAIILWSAIINESVFIVATTSIGTALLTRNVNKAPYIFSSLCLSLTRNGPKRSTPHKWRVVLHWHDPWQG